MDCWLLLDLVGISGWMSCLQCIKQINYLKHTGHQCVHTAARKPELPLNLLDNLQGCHYSLVELLNRHPSTIGTADLKMLSTSDSSKHSFLIWMCTL